MKRSWLFIAIAVVSGLLLIWALIAFWPTSTPPSTTPPSSSPTVAIPSESAPAAGTYRVASNLCAAIDFAPLSQTFGPTAGEAVADHSEKSNYVAHTCDRRFANGTVSVSALIFASADAANAQYKDVAANVTGATPVAGVGSAAFSSSPETLWVYDANLVFMVRFKATNGQPAAALRAAAVDLGKATLTTLHG